ncbi:MAG: hypothetical protein IPP14_07615 [Planctomycetes bacterium]|nr:hypothetical protein [Planctomycetota bacterium]
MHSLLAEMGSLAIFGIICASLAVVVIVVQLLRGKKPAANPPAAAPQSPQAAPAPQVPAVAPVPAPVFAPAPVPAPVAAPDPAPAPVPAPARPATLQVEALAPSETGMAPMLGEPMLEPAMDDMKMGTDELPRIGTGQVPMLADHGTETATKGRYRTPAAQQLADAIESMTCPKCSAPTFVGKETPQEVGPDGTGMFKLEARCGACGHKANVIDMRVG